MKKYILILFILVASGTKKTSQIAKTKIFDFSEAERFFKAFEIKDKIQKQNALQKYLQTHF